MLTRSRDTRRRLLADAVRSVTGAGVGESLAVASEILSHAVGGGNLNAQHRKRAKSAVGYGETTTQKAKKGGKSESHPAVETNDASKKGIKRNIKTKNNKKKKKHLKLKDVVKRVKKLEKEEKVHLAKETYFLVNTSQIAGTNNQLIYGDFSMVTPTIIQNLLTHVQVFNPAAVGTQLGINMTGVKENTHWKVRWYFKIIIRNNYAAPVDLDIYYIKPKTSDSSNPSADISNATQQTSLAATGGAFLYNNTITYPSMFPMFETKWKVLSHEKRRFDAGDEVTYSFSGTVNYNDYYFGTLDAADPSPKWTRFFMYKARGCLAHDSVTTSNIGYTAPKLDTIRETRLTIEYPNVTPIRTYNISETLQTLATANFEEQAITLGTA